MPVPCRVEETGQAEASFNSRYSNLRAITPKSGGASLTADKIAKPGLLYDRPAIVLRVRKSARTLLNALLCSSAASGQSRMTDVV